MDVAGDGNNSSCGTIRLLPLSHQQRHGHEEEYTLDNVHNAHILVHLPYFINIVHYQIAWQI